MTNPYGTDSPAATELAAVLRTLRLNTRPLVSTTDLAQRLGTSQSRVSRLERGRQLASPADAIAWGQALGATDDQLAAVELLAREAASHHVNWSAHYRIVRLAEGQREVARQETMTRRLRSWAPAMIPGTLQTRETALRIYDAAYPDRAGDERDEWLDARLARAQVLHDPARTFEYLIGEPALAWWTGHTDDHRAQLDRLIAAFSLPAVTIGIVPLGWIGAEPIQHSAAFNIFAERAPGHLPLVHIESKGDSLYGEDDLKRYSEAWEQLARVALFEDRGRSFIEDIRRELNT